MGEKKDGVDRTETKKKEFIVEGLARLRANKAIRRFHSFSEERQVHLRENSHFFPVWTPVDTRKPIPKCMYFHEDAPIELVMNDEKQEISSNASRVLHYIRSYKRRKKYPLWKGHYEKSKFK